MARRSPPNARASFPQVAVALICLALLVLVVVLAAHGSNGTADASSTPALPSPSPVPATPFTLTPIHQGPATGWVLPEPLLAPRDVAVGGDGTVWVTEQDTGMVDSLTGNVLTRHATNAFPDTGAFWLANGPSDTIWFSGYPGGNIGRVLSDDQANSFTALDPSSATLGIAEGPNDIMWVTDVNRGLLIRVQPDGVVDQLQVAPPTGVTAAPAPRDIVRGPDDAMWFTDPRTGSVGRVATSGTPSIVEHLVGAHSDPHSIAAGADQLWVTLGGPEEIAQIDPSSGAATTVKVPSAKGSLNDLLVAPDGTLWVSEDAPYLLHLRTDGSLIREVKLPAPASDADGLALASDGTLWAAAPDGNMIVSVRNAG